MRPTSAADGSTLGEFGVCGPDDVDRAVASARRAAPIIERLDVAERGRLLRALADELEAAADLAEIVALEVGTPLRLSVRLQVGLPVSVLREYARAIESITWSETVGNSTVTQRPVGVVAAVTPWNYPIHQVVTKFGAAFAAGCPVVLKPSDVALVSVAGLIDAIEQAGFPAGSIGVVVGGVETGRALVAHHGVDLVSFTGSTSVGAQVAQAAASRGIRTALELGGKSASVVLADADLPRAIKTSVGNAFLNSGQTCTAWSRLLVPTSRRDDAVDLAIEAATRLTVGHPLDSATRLGPLATQAQVDRTQSFVRIGDASARKVFESTLEPGLPAGGHYVPATIFADVDPASELAQEEVFGPVLAVSSFADEAEAIALANGTAYGLAAAVWSEDQDRAGTVASALQAGQVDINGAAFNPAAPFGGWKASGYGRELGHHGVLEFTHTQSIQR